MEFEVRLLTVDEAEVYRGLRLESLRAAPTAFGTSYEEDAARSLESFTDIVENASVFVVSSDGEDIGFAGLRVVPRRKSAHRGEIWGIYVREKHRGSGAASMLLDAVLTAARAQVVQIELTVPADNDRAAAFYRRYGFVEIGRIPRAEREAEGFVDEIMMYLPLGDSEGDTR